jgi:hypothetical protein
MRRAILSSFSIFLFSAIVFAVVHALYRIELKNGSELLSRDRPVANGSVMLFHSYPKGILTSVPEESVVRIVTSVEDVSSPLPLQPGDVVYLGPTGGEPPAEGAGTAAYSPPAIPGGVYDPRNPAAYSYGGAAPRNPNGMPINRSGNISDLGRALSGEPPTIGSNGFPSQPGLVTIMGPDGNPVLAPAGTPGAVPLTIGPDGNPILPPPGAPGSVPPMIGPNGTPVLGPPGAPGTAAPVIGPNGTPVLAPPGAPGSAPPVIGPNGTPIGPNPAPPVGSNGFPAPPPH